MGDQPKRRAFSFRFRLRSLIVAVAIAAIGLWAADRAYEWHTTVPLAAAVAEFNAKAAADSVGKHEPPLSEDEIVSAIKAQLPQLGEVGEIQQAFARIAHRRRLPKDASLNWTSAFGSGNGLVTMRYQVWWINLDIMTGPSTGYSLRIRETDDPVAGRQEGSP